ncbi:hypothetical protein DICPUDRAFT_88591 [Dictyostelium purpureum]|uniref:Thioredoxin n=1 Tax=Dictyostelium purpureum TaxID=5786 RepID=F0ZQB7_DICPU|nr:uncharacterized protein DICPUDRAFT_88591 [Dictyostelium purpureum]EGC33864.1 hypothetical protein DICPUDRAFT_88591 [Dictyostelium purpureum]|eukprot:XP_003289602.1 hypothetical protein DICPUDRAFT_88591 [Dictyostelium purpureum]
MTFSEPQNTTEYNQIFASADVAIVYLTATWCGPCRAIAPIFSRLANENPEIAFIKVDVDKCHDLPLASSVTGVPTFVAFRTKVEVDRKAGASPAAIEGLIKLLK